MYPPAVGSIRAVRFEPAVYSCRFELFDSSLLFIAVDSSCSSSSSCRS